uniref:Uncharacterized protein n=1 Tax=Bactrocera dorsalis TaxID=27457 RepID=A0A034WRX7_BACDO
MQHSTLKLQAKTASVPRLAHAYSPTNYCAGNLSQRALDNRMAGDMCLWRHPCYHQRRLAVAAYQRIAAVDRYKSTSWHAVANSQDPRPNICPPILCKNQG